MAGVYTIAILGRSGYSVKEIPYVGLLDHAKDHAKLAIEAYRRQDARDTALGFQPRPTCGIAHIRDRRGFTLARVSA